MNSLVTAGDRTTSGCMVINILDDWGIKASDQLNILALPEGTSARMLKRYMDDIPLPNEPEIMQRVCKGHAGQSTYLLV